MKPLNFTLAANSGPYQIFTAPDEGNDEYMHVFAERIDKMRMTAEDREICNELIWLLVESRGHA